MRTKTRMGSYRSSDCYHVGRQLSYPWKLLEIIVKTTFIFLAMSGCAYGLVAFVRRGLKRGAGDSEEANVLARMEEEFVKSVDGGGSIKLQGGRIVTNNQSKSNIINNNNNDNDNNSNIIKYNNNNINNNNKGLKRKAPLGYRSHAPSKYRPNLVGKQEEELVELLQL